MKPFSLPRRPCRRPDLLSRIRLSSSSRSFSSVRPPPRVRLQRLQTPCLYTNPSRSFHLPDLSSFLPSNGGGSRSNNNNNKNNTVTASRILPYSPEPLYKVISSVESYSQFLPFLTESTVTARDATTGYPSRAFLTVGYGPISETFTSEVLCDKTKWVVEAKSGARLAGQSQSQNAPGASEGIFEYLNTKWILHPLDGGRTKVDLEIGLEFRSKLHAAMLGAVQGEMAGVMIAAFEKRVREIQLE